LFFFVLSYTEFNLFVSNLHPDIDDIALFKLFGERYASCRGAKVFRELDGISKEQGDF
jgi:RNA recognition motif-containing protein